MHSVTCRRLVDRRHRLIIIIIIIIIVLCLDNAIAGHGVTTRMFCVLDLRFSTYTCFDNNIIRGFVTQHNVTIPFVSMIGHKINTHHVDGRIICAVL